MAQSAVFQRREAYYSGHVQGVGFRFTVQRVARPLDVFGFVRNLRDGRVELVAEGSPRELDRLLSTIASELEGNIADAQITTRRATHEFEAFEIRR